MKKFVTDFGISILLLSSSIVSGWFIITISGLTTAFVSAETNIGGTPMHKVQLTQKGYIQFLKWELPVPEIYEFTFCLWVKSNDLKQSHSIFSYSKDERERLIRSWISSRGRSIHLEINGVELFGRPVDIREHRWYHICQSWENRVGRYALWLDGHLEMQGHSEEMIDYVIPGGGDIVLGQEFTDFDKGLEEGIEGSVLGFNLLLASAFNSLDNDYRTPPFRPAVTAINPVELLLATRNRWTKITKRNPDLGRTLYKLISNQFAFSPNWSRKIFRNNGTKMVESPVILQSSHLLNIANDTQKKDTSPIRRDAATFGDHYSTGEINVSKKSSSEPLGLQLVKLSYVRCHLDRGSPPIGGSLMLVSWSRTPVKVFGGATIKNVGNECGNF